MLERQHLTVKDYNKDQKAYASMLNKMYVAAKEGELTGWVFYNTESFECLLIFSVIHTPKKVAFSEESFCMDLLIRSLVTS